MPKITVKDTRKAIRAMLDKHQKPPDMNPVDGLIKMAEEIKKKGMM